MTEERVAHLYQISSSISHALLKSYYLMRCHDLTKSYGLPTKQFSSHSRCIHCCSEWKEGSYETKVKKVCLSKHQKRRIKQSKEQNDDNEFSKSKKNLLNSNQLERTCLMCKHVTIIQTPKPERSKKAIQQTTKSTKVSPIEVKKHVKEKNPKLEIKIKEQNKKKSQLQTAINVYSNTRDVFSLQNNNNTVKSAVKEPIKKFQNNKKKKDKFAGLQREAVLASAKIKKTELGKNNLNLFLKPST